MRLFVRLELEWDRRQWNATVATMKTDELLITTFMSPLFCSRNTTSEDGGIGFWSVPDETMKWRIVWDDVSSLGSRTHH